MFEFKTSPFPHQKQTWNETREVNNFAVFWEQGTGKTKLTVDTAAWLAYKGKIDSMLVVAPSGVHTNWVKDEIPTHMPDFVNPLSHFYQTSKANTSEHKQAMYDLVKHRGLSVMAISYDAFMTKAGKQTVWDFMRKRKSLLYVLDEAGRIKNPKAKRTKAIIKSSIFGQYKRILTGTPIANGPFDIYSPLEFLDSNFWKQYRFPSYYIFSHYFGNIVKKRANLGHEYEFVDGYKNVEELYHMLKGISSRVTKDMVLKDLPPKLYQKRYFEMSPEQEKVYAELKNELMTTLDGEVISTPLAITLLLRLQQVTSGYLPSQSDPDNVRLIPIPGPNVRLETLLDLCEEVNTQGIIWARFKMDIDQIIAGLGRENCARYDGAQSESDRRQAKEEFKRGKRQWFVATTAVGGEGLTLNEAKRVIYYNNSYKLTERLQSEDRAHRIGQRSSVTYDDLICMSSIDEMIVGSLRKKLNLANIITGDKLKEWL